MRMVTKVKKNWFRRHLVISIFLGLMVWGMIGSIFDSGDNPDITGNVVNEQSAEKEKLVYVNEQFEEKDNVIEPDSPKKNEEDLSSMSVSKKKKLCTELCAGESIDIPYIKSECSLYCSQLYYYGGEEALDNEIKSYN